MSQASFEMSRIFLVKKLGPRLKQTLVVFLAIFSVSACNDCYAANVKGRFVFNSMRTVESVKDHQIRDWAYLWEDGKIRLLRKNLMGPVLSPNGKMIAGTTMLNGRDERERRIEIIDLEGNLIKTLSFREQVGRIKWSPDGMRIIYWMASDEEGISSTLNEYDLSTGESRLLLHPKPASGIGEFNFFPDGKRMAVEINSQKELNIYILDLKSGEKTKIPNTLYHGLSGVFPNNRHIAAYDYNDGTFKNPGRWIYYKIDALTGEREEIGSRSSGFSLSGARLSNDGNYFYRDEPVRKKVRIIAVRPLSDPSKMIPVTQAIKIKGRLYSFDSNPDWWQAE